jgi:hypothetical protein
MGYSRAGFFTEIRPVRIGDLGTGEKKLNFASWSLYFKDLHYITRNLLPKIKNSSQFMMTIFHFIIF